MSADVPTCAVEHGSLDGDAVSVILASLRIHRPRTKLGRPQPHGNSHHRRPRFLSFLFAFFPPNFVPGEQHHNPSCSADIPPSLFLTHPTPRPGVVTRCPISNRSVTASW